MEVIFISNDITIKGRIEPTLGDAFKEILNKKKMTQQDFIDLVVKDFVLNNLNLIISKGNKESK